MPTFGIFCKFKSSSSKHCMHSCAAVTLNLLQLAAQLSLQKCSGSLEGNNKEFATYKINNK